MIKRLLLLTISMKAAAFAQFKNENSLYYYVESSLRKAKWLPHQCFEFDLGKDGHIIAYNAIEAKDLEKHDSLASDAKSLVEKMVRVINESVTSMSINVAVHYFDKTRYLVGNTTFYWLYVKDNKITKFDLYPLEVDPNILGFSNYAAIESLRGFKLAPNQFLVSFMIKNKLDPKEPNDAVALVNIVDDWNGDRLKQSKRQANALVKYTGKGGPFRRIVVRFQQRSNAGNKKDFTYPIL